MTVDLVDPPAARPQVEVVRRRSTMRSMPARGVVERGAARGAIATLDAAMSARREARS